MNGEPRLGLGSPVTFESREGRGLTFTRWEQVKDWAEGEASIWDGFNNVQQKAPWLQREARRLQLEAFTHLAAHVGRILTINAANAEAENAQVAANKQINFIRKWRPFFSTDAEGQRLAQLARSDLNAASVGILISLGVGLNVTASENNEQLSLSQITIGAFEQLAAQRGWTTNVEAEKASLKQLRGAWDSQLSERVTQHTQMVTELRAQVGTAAEAEGRRSTRMDTFIEASQRRVDELVDLYRNQLRLEAPANYWAKKALWHRAVSVFAFVAFVIAAGALVWNSVQSAQDILEALRDPVDKKIGLGTVALASPAVFLVLYFFRMLMKLFNGGLAAAADARQREALIYTFLALAKDKETDVRPEERLLVLQAIFRSAQSGPEDDAPPANLIDLMQRMGEPAKR